MSKKTYSAPDLDDIEAPQALQRTKSTSSATEDQNQRSSCSGESVEEVDEREMKMFGEDKDSGEEEEHEDPSTVDYLDKEDDDDDNPNKYLPNPEPKGSVAMAPLRFAWLTVSTMGIVYGDIGTSPLYTWATILSDFEDHPYEEEDLIGAMCILVYSLILIVAIKYAIFILMADNRGEGGIFALTSLVPPTRKDIKTKMSKEIPRYEVWIKRICVALSIIGAGFIFGDGAITPAVSVLSAIEGLGVVNSDVPNYEVIIGLTILSILFLSQPFGSGQLAIFLGPIMLVWFMFIGAVGLYNIIEYNPGVMRAFNPYWGYQFFARNGLIGYKALGGICLCFTGAEALYADMGHFGKWPLRAGVYFVVLPSVSLSYFGQLAYLLRFPNAASSPFFESVPSEVFWPVMVVATMAAIIASQAMISGTFSLISQGMGLGTIPPMTLTHTSKRMHGQVYAPVGNWILMATTLGLILFFQSSSALAAAYGIAVTGTLAITTLIFMAMVVLRWKWSAFVVVPVCLFFFAIEMIYFSANMTKFPNGGWVALLLAAATIIFMGSWKLGQSDVSRTIAAKRHKKTIRDVIRWASDPNVPRIPCTGVFLGGGDEDCEGVPKAVLQHMKVHRYLPTTVILVVSKTIDLPQVRSEARLSCRALCPGLIKLTARRGYIESRSDVGEMLQQAEAQGLLKPDPQSPHYHYFIARQSLQLRESRRVWSRIRLSIYNFMVMNARPPACQSLIIPKQGLIEYHSSLLISKPLPGDNLVCRFVNRKPTNGSVPM